MKRYMLAALLMICSTPAFATVQELIDSVKKQDVLGVKTLLAYGENVNEANAQGNTALHYAVAVNNAQLVQMLLADGADMHLKNAKGWSPLMIAEKKNIPEVYAILNQARNKEIPAPQVVQEEAVKTPAAENTQETQETRKKENEKVVAVIKTEEKPQEKTQAAQHIEKKEKVEKTVEKKTTAEPVLSAFSQEVRMGDEEIIYCLNYLALQGEQKNMTVAAAYFAMEAGVEKQRHDRVIAISKRYFENASEEEIKRRADECARVITPPSAAKQNQIIRSLNKSMGY